MEQGLPFLTQNWSWSVRIPAWNKDVGYWNQHSKTIWGKRIWSIIRNLISTPIFIRENEFICVVGKINFYRLYFCRIIWPRAYTFHALNLYSFIQVDSNRGLLINIAQRSFSFPSNCCCTQWEEKKGERWNLYFRTRSQQTKMRLFWMTLSRL